MSTLNNMRHVRTEQNGTPWNVPDEKGRLKIQVPGLGQVYHTVTR